MSNLADLTLNLSDGLSPDERKFRLDYADRDNVEDSDGDGDTTNDKDYLSHKALNLGAISPSIYYRIVKIESETGEPHPTIEASIEVHWLESGAPKKIAIPVTITNYYRET